MTPRNEAKASRARNAEAYFLNCAQAVHAICRRSELSVGTDGKICIREWLGKARAKRLSAERLGWRLP